MFSNSIDYSQTNHQYQSMMTYEDQTTDQDSCMELDNSVQDQPTSNENQALTYFINSFINNPSSNLKNEAKVLSTQPEKLNDKNLCTKEGKTYLHLAAMTGEYEFARILILSGNDINAKDNQGKTPLHLCCESTHAIAPEIFELLLKNGANPSIQDYYKQTPLHTICSRPKGPEKDPEDRITMQLFHLYLVAPYSEQQTTLNQACLKRNPLNENPLNKDNILVNKFLCGWKAVFPTQVNTLNSNSRTPLDLACINKHYGIAEELLAQGASVSYELYNFVRQSTCIPQKLSLALKHRYEKFIM